MDSRGEHKILILLVSSRGGYKVQSELDRTEIDEFDPVFHINQSDFDS